MTSEKLIDEAVAIDQAEPYKSTYAPQLGKALPARKVARYMKLRTKSAPW